jgi:ubiquinone/menaquinone biosynthesis C-methylase UbiE
MKPFRFKIIQKHLPNFSNLKVLDIGCGSHSPSLTKKYLPNCTYHAIDLTNDYNNDSSDIEKIDAFFKKDLTLLDFDEIQNNHYDVLIMSHVIEHLENGDEVIRKLTQKLKKGGIIYLEFPSERSVKFPSMQETLNFYDDPTHCRIFSIKEVKSILEEKHFQILEAKTRREWLNIILIPIKVPIQLLTKGYIRGGTMWDLYGFAEFVVGRK